MVRQYESCNATIRKTKLLVLVTLLISSLNAYSQKTEEAIAQRVLAEGCGIFFVAEVGSDGTKFLQAFELKQDGEFVPEVDDLVTILLPAPGDKSIGNNTFERYLTRLETAITQGNHDNDVVTKPVGVNQSVSISKQSAATMNAYQYSLMQTAAGESFRARRESFLSIFPDNNRDDQIATISSLCPDLEGLEEALAALDQAD